MARRSMAQPGTGVTVGVDTHADMHVAAAFDTECGRPLGHCQVVTTPTGYRELVAWARTLGDELRFGLEGTSSYGAGVARFLSEEGYPVFEVNRPDRQLRRARGKSDPVDAEAAARAVLSGEATALAKRDDEHVGMIKALRVARRSAVKGTTQATNQIKSLIVSAPARRTSDPRRCARGVADRARRRWLALARRRRSCMQARQRPGGQRRSQATAAFSASRQDLRPGGAGHPALRRSEGMRRA